MLPSLRDATILAFVPLLVNVDGGHPAAKPPTAELRERIVRLAPYQE